MSELPLQGADTAYGSVRSCAQVTVAVMDWDLPVESIDRALKIAALPDPAAPLTGCSAMVSHGELRIHGQLILGDLALLGVGSIAQPDVDEGISRSE